jgi:hypothetical protein
MLFKLRYPKILTFSVIHGDVEFVYYPVTKADKIMGFFHKLMFKFSVQNFYYLFLTPISKQIMVASKRTKASQTLAIELPTFPNENKYILENKQQNSVLKIGHIGSAGVRKNVQLFYELAAKLVSHIQTGALECSNVGVLESSIAPFLNPLIVNFVGDEINKPLAREAYDKKITALDYAIFFYGPNDFILRSSAAFFDAIYYEKPIIALRNTFFSDVFEREGAIGYLCDDVDEMRQVVELMIKNKENFELKREVFVQNIKYYKEKLTVDRLSVDLKKAIDYLATTRDEVAIT